MKKDLDYYEKWYQKWIRIFRKLCDKCESNFKLRNLIEKIKRHFWLIEWRLLCFKWYGENAEESPMYPKTLKYN